MFSPEFVLGAVDLMRQLISGHRPNNRQTGVEAADFLFYRKRCRRVRFPDPTCCNRSAPPYRRHIQHGTARYLVLLYPRLYGDRC